jgi:bifunctional UDP-N-acetylglucosamine pyrophosphorylase/glucosamine-1-phosphate N-acetyltransferase
MPDQQAAALILAAGKGTRMKSELPKVLHAVAGRPMLERVFDVVRRAGLEEIHTVVGYGAEQVQKRFEGQPALAGWIVQKEQKGTGDAVRVARPSLGERSGTLLILAGDIPLLLPRTLASFLDAHHRAGARASLITTEVEEPGHYGRVVRSGDGSLARIVEDRDATEEERQIREINTGIYAFDLRTLFEYAERLTPANDQKEYYLTDVFGMLVRDGHPVRPVKLHPADEFLGINNRVELAAAEARVRARKVRELMLAGVTVHDPLTTYVDDGVEVGTDTELYPNVSLYGTTRLGKKCVIRSGSVLRDTVLADGASVLESCVLDRAELGPNAAVGPMAHLRPGSKLGTKAKVGNFVEVKNSTLGDGTKASHLSYLGDAVIGKGSNIGAGTITCNYDGYHKHQTKIGDDVFVGSDSTLVAPVTLGDRAFVAAASCVTRDVPAGALAVARSRQDNKLEYRKLIEDRHAAICQECSSGTKGHKD